MTNVFKLWFSGFVPVATEVLMSLAPIVVIFFALKAVGMRVRPAAMKQICFGFIITFVGLVLFMQGVNVAFLPVGNYLGESLASMENNWMLIPIGFVIGFLVAFAEPAVHVMAKQVEELSSGAIKSKMLLAAISLGLATAVMGSLIRLLYGFSIWWYLVPGYLIVFVLARLVDPTFMAIAFDNGGVATGPMCSTFVLTMSVAVAGALPGRDPLLDGFGVVSLIALTPIITTLILSFIVQRRKNVPADAGRNEADLLSNSLETPLENGQNDNAAEVLYPAEDSAEASPDIL